MALAVRARRPNRLTYATMVSLHPVSLSGFALALGIVTSYLGGAGAALVLTAYLVVSSGTASMARVQRALDRHLVSRARLRREAARKQHLSSADTLRRLQYDEVCAAIVELERRHPDAAGRLELESLLEYFVRVACEHGSCVYAQRIADTSVIPPATARTPRSRAIVERRLSHRDACNRRLDSLGDELDAIEQLVRLYTQLLACPLSNEDLSGEIERRLWELDEVDDAIERLDVDLTRGSAGPARLPAGTSVEPP